jgi:thioredoxin-related protein
VHAFLKSALLALGLALVPATYSSAATLVMVDWNACPHCWQFHRQVEAEYPASHEGHLAPLRRVSVLKKWPSDLQDIKPAYATPVFILVDNGHEIGRFSGYSDPTLFYREVDQLIAKM